MTPEQNFKPKTDFEKNIILRGLIRLLRKKYRHQINVIKALLSDIATLKLVIKKYGKVINTISVKLGEERTKNKLLTSQLKKKEQEIYNLIITKYTKKNGTS